MVSCNPQLSVEGDEYVCGWDETDSFCNGHHCEVCSISLCNLDCGDEYCARTRTAADREATVCMLCKHPLEEGEAFNQFAYDWFKDGKRIEWSYGKFHYPEDSDSETFDVEFDEWADQEMMTHGKDISFKDWAEDEGMKHGNTEITEWAQHEDESHDARFGAEEIWCDSCGEDGLSGDFHVITSMPVDFDSGSAGESATLCGDCYSKYGAEELKKDSCCCGATKSWNVMHLSMFLRKEGGRIYGR